MSLESIISQLQSIQPYRGSKVTAESIASDITKTRNSIIRLAKLLQRSGRVAGEKYLPNQALNSNNAKAQSKTLERLTREVNKLSSDHNKLKAYTQQSINNLKRQISSLKNNVERNSSVIKSIKSELALQRPQKEIKKAVNSTNAKLQSFNKFMRTELTKINRKINNIQKEQVRIIQRIDNLESGKTRTGAAGDDSIVGRGTMLNFKQRLNYVERLAEESKLRSTGSTLSLAGSDLRRGSPEEIEHTKEFVRGLTLIFGGAAVGTAAHNLSNMFVTFMGGKQEEILDVLGLNNATPTSGAPTMNQQGEVSVTSGRPGPAAARDLLKKEQELLTQLESAKDDKTKTELKKKIEEIKTQRLKTLLDAGIITSEHVQANMAKQEDITFYKNVTASGVQYIDAAVVKEYPEIWQSSSESPDIVVLKPDWKKTVEGNPELKEKIRKRAAETRQYESEKDRPTIAIRNNNPGAIMYNPNLVKPGSVLENAVGADDAGYAIFETKQHGVDALIRQVNIDTQTRKMTVADFISKYAPAGHGENNPQRYAEFIEEKTGLKPTDTVPKEKVKGVVEAITEFEGGPGAIEIFKEYIDSKFEGLVSTTTKSKPEESSAETLVAKTVESNTPSAETLVAKTVEPEEKQTAIMAADSGATPNVLIPEVSETEVAAEIQKKEMVVENETRDQKINEALGLTLGQNQQIMALASTLEKSITILGQKTNRALSMADSGVSDYTVRDQRLSKYV